ncbi:hypothetical protein GCM10010201_22560 [Pilimelia columellifera subsp. columellifera]|uniref:Uncharacterized protein n=1 Tax=Pilimelia columellifera subsp. columellifera TaxID=706583 RepID=A0ABN3NIZ4_9ACTN
MVSDTAMVTIMAMVIVRLRQSPTSTSDRTYFARIGFPSVAIRVRSGWRPARQVVGGRHHYGDAARRPAEVTQP